MDLMPEASSAPPAARRRYFWRSLATSLLFLVTYLGATLISTGDGPGLLAAGLAAIAFASVGLLGYEFIVLLRSLDELQQMIQIRALAMGFAVVLSVLTLAGLVSKLVVDGALDAALAMAAALSMPLGMIAYVICIHLVKRRYE